MHKIKVLALGSNNFNISLDELKDHLNFELILSDNEQLALYDILLIHENFIKQNNIDRINQIKKMDKIKILLFKKDEKSYNYFTDKIFLPLNINELNKKVEDSIIKKDFNKNSYIKIKEYILDKNEKKLSKNNKFIFLTEKEIQLLELLLIKEKPSSKNEILEKVWKYVADADTHTVETHIYRLRKKIKSKFSDDNFILNDKSGYLI